MDIIREAPCGQCIRWLTSYRVFQFPEERAVSAAASLHSEKHIASAAKSDTSSIQTAVEKRFSPASEASYSDGQLRTCDVVIDWCGKDDTANPINWRTSKKLLTNIIICLYTCVVYTTATVYAGSEGAVISTFGVSNQTARLPLSMFILSFGIGPMLFGPLSEMPSVGRNKVYSLTSVSFAVMTSLIPMTKSFPGLVVMRLLCGIFGSSCLAVGGASIKDMHSESMSHFALIPWVAATCVGSSVAPLISACSVDMGDWRWPLWALQFVVIPLCLLINICLPETSARTILLQRAHRLRKIAASDNFKAVHNSQESERSGIHKVGIALMRPMQISVFDPSIMFTAIYSSLVYGIYYSFFEVFPLVYTPLYGFNSIEASLVFICSILASAVAAVLYITYIYVCDNTSTYQKESLPQVAQLKPALFACFLPPAGLFLFGWAANGKIHWAVSVLGIVVYSIGVYVNMQAICAFISHSYPTYSASLFAANEFMRNLVAAGAIHVSRPLYADLGIARGTSLLAGFSALGIAGMFYIYFYGRRMREQSSFPTGPY